jgi:hypothetical protein
MAKVFSIIVALGLTVALAAPAVAGTGPNAAPPTMQRTCEKAKMKSDAQIRSAALLKRHRAAACSGGDYGALASARL